MPDEEMDAAIAEATEETGGLPEEENAPIKMGDPIPEVKDEEPAEEAEPEAEPEAKEEEAEEEPEPEEEPEEEEPEPLVASAEELKAINDDPALRKLYKSMQQGLTKKSTALAEEKKAAAEQVELVKWMKENPDEAVQALAQRRGYTLTRAEQAAVNKAEDAAVDAIAAKWEEQVGPETTKLLLPLVREVISQSTQQYIQPLQQQQEALEKQALERAIAATTEEFGAVVVQRGDDWDDSIQKEMAEMVAKITPADDVAPKEFLGIVYDAVTTQRNKTSAMKKQVRRMQKAKGSAEPTRTSRPAPVERAQITDDMSDKDATSLAVEMAFEEVRNAG